jgi:hypothetical protein
MGLSVCTVPHGGQCGGAYVVFPQAWVAQVGYRNSRLKILPTAVLGSSVLNSINLGCL